MKLIILSKGRADTISTHKLFEDYTLVLHTEEEKAEYLKNPSISPEKIVVSGAPFGVAHQRKWIQENLVLPNEWYISLDDNIKSFQSVPEPTYSELDLPVQSADIFTRNDLKAKFETEISGKRFLEICEHLAVKGEKERAYNIGFGTTANFFFRGRHFRYVGYVISKACVRKNVGTPFELENQSMEDYAYTAETLLRYGKVLIDNYTFPVAGHYEKGGIGTYAERLPAKIRDSAFLIEKYPGLFRYNQKKGSDPNGELIIRFNSLGQVEKWRATMRGIKNKTP
jgi:hypothetical protein